MTPSRRFTLAMAIVALALFFAQDAKSDELKVVPPVPDAISVAADTTPAVEDRGPAAPIEVISIQQQHAMSGIAYVSPAAKADSAEYRRIYNSVPFSRAEYKASDQSQLRTQRAGEAESSASSTITSVDAGFGFLHVLAIVVQQTLVISPP